MARAVDALTIAPDRFYQRPAWRLHGTAVGVLDAAATRRHDEDYRPRQDILWQIATGLERGGLMSAAEQLRRIQQMLSQALAQGAPQEVIDSLLQRYREALQRYLQALAQNPPANDAKPPPGAKVDEPAGSRGAAEGDPADGAERRARAGAADARAAAEPAREPAHDQWRWWRRLRQSPQDKALSDAIQGLGDLMGKQRGLIDKTLRQEQGKAIPRMAVRRVSRRASRATARRSWTR